MQPVAGCFGKAGIAAGLGLVVNGRVDGRVLVAHAAGNIAVSASDFHRVGRDDAPLLAGEVAQLDAGFLARVEIEVSQVNPGASTHGLVDAELRFAAPVIHGVEGVVGTSLDRVVGHVDGIPAALGNRSLPAGPYRPVGVGRGLGLAEAPLGKGILRLGIDLSPVGEADASALPLLFAGGALGVGRGVVVVGNQFMPVGIPLAGREDIGPGILQHGGEEGHDETLGKEVLHGAEDAGPLPLPPVERLFEIVSVALPQRDVTVEQSVSGGIESPHRLDDGAVAGHGKPLVTVGKGYQPTDFVTAGIDGEFLVSQFRGEDGPHGVVGLSHQFIAKGKVGELVVHLDGEAIPLLGETLQLDFANVQIIGFERGERLLDGRFQIAGLGGAE